MDKDKRVSAREKDNGEFVEMSNKQGVLIRWIGEFDRPFLLLVITLVCLGTIAVFTSSYAYAETNFGDSYYFAKKQFVYGIAGLFIMVMIGNFVRHGFIFKLAELGYVVAFVLNVAVVAIGLATNGAQRWLDLKVVRFQPSEVLKLMTIVICAKYLCIFQEKLKTFRYGVLPFVILLIPSVLVLVMQSHLSATIITSLLIFSMMVIGGSNIVWVGAIGGIGAAGAAFAITNIDMIINLSFVQSKLGHVYKRLLIWQDPLKYMRDAATGDAGWQPSQSLFAISSGGLWGVGLGQSMEKHGWLPEPQNDYIFSIICEEMGFVGAVIIIALFAALIIRGFYIAKNCKDRFCQLLVNGIMIKLAMQVILNIAVVTNTIPSTGISLPFFSAGGTALIMSLCEMGIVLSISRYSYSVRGSSAKKAMSVKSDIEPEVRG